MQAIGDLSSEQRRLWERTRELWALAERRDAEPIRAAIHPRYVGWDMSGQHTHDREAAVSSVLNDATRVDRYDLRPLSIEIYDAVVGVVHYSYSASVTSADSHSAEISGKWTEVYLMKDGEWLLIAVSGRPDPQKEDG